MQALVVSLSTHSDRHALFLTKQQPVANIKTSVNFISEWNGLMGALPAAPMERSAVVEVLPAADAHNAGTEPSPGVTALTTDTPAS